MIEIVPQTKKIFSQQAQALMQDLKNKILDLDVQLSSFHQQLDSIISIIKLVRNAAVKADFFIPNSPLAKIIHNLESLINSLRDRHTEIDWVAKELLIEIINMSNQVVNEYCLEMDLSKDWIELQSNLFAQINEHLQSGTDETISRKNLNLYSIADEPFNLEDTPEALHLFDMNFELSKLEDYIAPIETLDNSDGFLMIQIDQEQDDCDSSKLLQKVADNSHDELTTLFPSLIDAFTGDLDEFNEDLPESHQTSNEERLPMPELFAEIFSATVSEPSLKNNNKTENQSIKWNEQELENEDTDEVEDVWTKFTAMESWAKSNEEELVPAFDLSDFNSSNNDVSEDMTPNNFFESLDSSTSSLDSANNLQPKPSTSPSSSNTDSSTMLAEMLKEDFPTSDIDTAIEESPIYQNNTEDVSSSWHDLSRMNFGDTEISYADFAALSVETKSDMDLDMSSINTSQVDIPLDIRGNDATVRIPLNHLEMFGDLSEELLVRKGSLDIYLGEIKALSSQAQNHLQSLEFNADSRQNQTAIAGLQNTVEQIVNVLALTEQQTYAMSQDVNHLRKNLRQVLKHPISSLVTRFPRILRDLSSQYGKQVELVVQGAGVEVERLISETIAEPLEILLRNAFKHGIESPHDRQQQGKAPQGKIEFIATQTDESTIIKVIDDGCGIDIEKLRHQVEQSATIAGMSGFSTMDMSDEQLINLIFEPSFNLVHSSSATGNKLSDVKKKLREFGGGISVKSQRGKGTQFTLVLPNVLSLIRVLLIDINQMCLAIPSKVILEVVPSSNSPILDSEEQETLLWRDRELPIVRLNSLLKLNCRHSLSQSSLQSTNQSPQTNSPESQKPSQAISSLLVIHYENELFALRTDGCWHDQEATFHQIEGNILLPRIFLGTVVLGSSQAVALLNPAELVSQCLQSNNHVSGSQEIYANFDSLSSLSDFFSAGDTSPSLPIAAVDSSSDRDLVRIPESENLESSGLFTSELVKSQVRRSHQPRVLIVESSANVRRYLAMSLTKSGFLTEQVQDGKEAIAFLKNCLDTKLKVDAVITDLEMPHMDGFKLLSNVLIDDDLHNLPFIVLTAKNNENDRKLALDLGAKAYFCKPYREKELVEKLHQVISA